MKKWYIPLLAFLASPMHTCKKCQQGFTITDQDKAYYAKIEVPMPTWCPTCRQMRRMIWRNERQLFRRTSSKSGQSMVSMFPEGTPFPVYTDKEWNADDWTLPEQEWDPSRPFLEQWRELQLKTPRAAMFRVEESLQNSEFTNCCTALKDCYMVYGAGDDEGCLYSVLLDGARDVCDGYAVANSELCYEVLDASNCYNVQYAEDVKNCRNSMFLMNCIGCADCFGCVNLRNKQYCLWNRQLTKEAYEEEMKKIDLGKYSEREKYLALWERFKREYGVHAPMRGVQNENATGDYLNNTSEVEECFDCTDIQDSKYCTQVRLRTKDSYDYDYWGYESELMYECIGAGTNCYNVKFSANITTAGKNLEYCDLCRNVSDCFGCVGLREKKYCILNKQYTPEDYHKTVALIKESMQKDGSYGEFFPLEYAPHAFNCTTAYDFYPLTQAQVEGFGAQWQEIETVKGEATYTIPDHIREVGQTLPNEVLSCVTCQKNYKITGVETALYLRQNIPVPRTCFSCRHMQRVRKRNPRKLFQRTCMKGCRTTFTTTFAPDRPEKVYCTPCFHAHIQ